LNTAREHAQENHLDIRYEKHRGEKIPYEDSSFDVILCCDVLEHVRDLRQLYRRFSRVLKDNGIFIYDHVQQNILK